MKATPDNDDDLIPSKSQIKREMDELQELGQALTELSRDTLKHLVLPDDLRSAVVEYKRLNAHGAQRRQRQYIGRIMRNVDPEPIRIQLATLRGENTHHNSWLHGIERQRDRLMADDKVLSELVAEHPGCDVQQLRTLIRNARREQAESRPPKSFRELFQALKALHPEPPLVNYKQERDGDDDEDA